MADDPRVTIVRDWFNRHNNRKTEDHGLRDDAPAELLELLDWLRDDTLAAPPPAEDEVERVALALYLRRYPGGNFGELVADDRDNFTSQARAAIAAITRKS